MCVSEISLSALMCFLFQVLPFHMHHNAINYMLMPLSMSLCLHEIWELYLSHLHRIRCIYCDIHDPQLCSIVNMDSLEDQVQFAHRAFGQVLDDRDSLATENKYLKSLVVAQQLQLQRYKELLRISRGEQPKFQIPLGQDRGIWAAGTFLYLPSEDSHLATVVKVLQQTHGKQRALALLTILLGQELSDTQRISGLLLLSTILRGSHQDTRGEILQKALTSTDEALVLAANLQNPKLIGRAHFHRAVCLLHLGRFADARWSLALASNTDAAYAEAVSATWSILE